MNLFQTLVIVHIILFTFHSAQYAIVYKSAECLLPGTTDYDGQFLMYF